MSQVNKQVNANGDVVNHTLTVSGDDVRTCSNVVITFTIPNGVSLTGPSDAGSSIINVPKGFYNTTTDKWHVGDLAAGESVSNTFEFTVDDIGLADVDDTFTLTFTGTSSCTEAASADNSSILIITVVEECTQVVITAGVDASISDITFSA